MKSQAGAAVVMARFHLRQETVSLGLWTAAIAAYNVFTVGLFDNYRNNSVLVQTYEGLPDVWKNFLGREAVPITEFEGWMGAQFFAFLPLVLGVFLAMLVASFISKELEHRSVEVLLVQGISRTMTLITKLACAALSLVMILGANAAISLVAVSLGGVKGTSVSVLMTFYDMVLEICLFFLGVFGFVALVTADQKQSFSINLGIIMFLFVANSLMSSVEVPTFFKQLNPFYFYDASRVSLTGSFLAAGRWYWLTGALVASAASVVVFSRKNIL